MRISSSQVVANGAAILDRESQGREFFSLGQACCPGGRRGPTGWAQSRGWWNEWTWPWNALFIMIIRRCFWVSWMMLNEWCQAFNGRYMSLVFCDNLLPKLAAGSMQGLQQLGRDALKIGQLAPQKKRPIWGEELRYCDPGSGVKVSFWRARSRRVDTHFNRCLSWKLQKGQAWLDLIKAIEIHRI